MHICVLEGRLLTIKWYLADYLIMIIITFIDAGSVVEIKRKQLLILVVFLIIVHEVYCFSCPLVIYLELSGYNWLSFNIDLPMLENTYVICPYMIQNCWYYRDSSYTFYC